MKNDRAAIEAWLRSPEIRAGIAVETECDADGRVIATTVTDILTCALRLPPYGRAEQVRVAAVLRDLGWLMYRQRNPYGHVWVSPEFKGVAKSDALRGREETKQGKASTILRDAAQAIGDRAALRDCPDGERSMARCVSAFNAITGHNLTEVEGWHFMELLKLSRATAGCHHLDDHTDRAAYAALAGEAADKAKAEAEILPEPGA